MADSVRQRLFNAVETRFKTISVTNGYQTDIGAKVFAWRNLEKDPLQESESQLLNIIDWKENSNPITLGNPTFQHELIFQIEVENVVSGNDADKTGRKIIADIQKCLGVDMRWQETPGDLTTALAFSTLPVDTPEGTNLMEIKQADRIVVSVKYQFKINYRTRGWDAFTKVP
jgi:hypothetical protein